MTNEGLLFGSKLKDNKYKNGLEYSCRSKYRNTNSGKNPLFLANFENIEITESGQSRYFSRKFWCSSEK